MWMARYLSRDLDDRFTNELNLNIMRGIGRGYYVSNSAALWINLATDANRFGHELVGCTARDPLKPMLDPETSFV
jgi:hypothetical protein